MGRQECELKGCSTRAVGGGTPHRKAHGGGKHEGCTLRSR
jgi:hypothetical protein